MGKRKIVLKGKYEPHEMCCVCGLRKGVKGSKGSDSKACQPCWEETKLDGTREKYGLPAAVDRFKAFAQRVELLASLRLKHRMSNKEIVAAGHFASVPAIHNVAKRAKKLGYNIPRAYLNGVEVPRHLEPLGHGVGVAGRTGCCDLCTEKSREYKRSYKRATGRKKKSSG